MNLDLGFAAIKVDVWQLVLLGVALAGIAAVLIGVDVGWLGLLFGMGTAAKRQHDHEQGQGAPDVPDRPEAQQTEPTTEYSEAADDVDDQAIRDEVSEMSDDEVLDALKDEL